MAPEQLEGKEADARADIFAFGAILHEMTTGRKAFESRSQASLVAAIMQADPPAISTLQPSAPPLLDHVVSRCLAKDRDDRWQTTSDLMQRADVDRARHARVDGAHRRDPVGRYPLEMGGIRFESGRRIACGVRGLPDRQACARSPLTVPPTRVRSECLSLRQATRASHRSNWLSRPTGRRWPTSH